MRIDHCVGRHRHRAVIVRNRNEGVAAVEVDGEVADTSNRRRRTSRERDRIVGGIVRRDIDGELRDGQVNNAFVVVVAGEQIVGASHDHKRLIFGRAFDFVVCRRLVIGTDDGNGDDLGGLAACAVGDGDFVRLRPDFPFFQEIDRGVLNFEDPRNAISVLIDGTEFEGSEIGASEFRKTRLMLVASCVFELDFADLKMEEIILVRCAFRPLHHKSG